MAIELKDFVDLDALQTGYPSLDYFVGGIPRGRFVMFSGRENSGKTTLGLNLVAELQQRYPQYKVLWIDNEGSFTKQYAMNCGVIEQNFSVYQNNDIQDCLSAALDFIKSNNLAKVASFVVIDSVAGFSSEAELRKGFDGDTVAVVSRIINKFLRLSTIPILNYGSVVVFTNQLRENLNSQFGGTTTPGGRGLRHWCSLHLQLYDTSEKIELDGQVIGQQVAVAVQKIKSSAAFKGFSFNLPLVYGRGFSKQLDILNMALTLEVVAKAGSWLRFGDLKYHGKGELITALQTDAALEQQLAQAVQAKIGS